LVVPKAKARPFRNERAAGRGKKAPVLFVLGDASRPALKSAGAVASEGR
jgi:hypothetical protein